MEPTDFESTDLVRSGGSRTTAATALLETTSTQPLVAEVIEVTESDWPPGYATSALTLVLEMPAETVPPPTATPQPLAATPSILPLTRQPVWKRNPILNFLTRLFNARTWRALGFALLMGVVGLAALAFIAVPIFVLMWGLAALTSAHTIGGVLFGLFCLVITIPLGGLIIAGARAWGKVFRNLIGFCFGDVIEPPSEFVRPSLNSWRDFWPAIKVMFLDGTGWRATLYILTTAVTIGLSLLASAFTLWPAAWAITYPFWWFRIPQQWITANFNVVINGVGQPPQQLLVGPGATLVFDGGFLEGFLLPVIPHLEVTMWERIFWADWIIPLNTWPRAIITALVGLLLLLIWAALMRLFGRLFRALGRSLLGARPADLREARLRAQRAAVVNDADLRLQQIERELHDGTQAQLVAVAMLLGEAKELLAAGAPRPATELVDSAHLRVKEALTDLREIASGIRPPALDAGLGVALQTLAARCPVPVSLVVGTDVDAGLDPAESAIAYYSVSELLGNVVKHANARSAAVDVLRNGSMLHIRVRDDGVGGAHIVGVNMVGETVSSFGSAAPAPVPPSGSKRSLGSTQSATETTHGFATHGTGLAGIAARLATIDGTLYIHSPEGGPTIIDMTIPTMVGG